MKDNVPARRFESVRETELVKPSVPAISLCWVNDTVPDSPSVANSLLLVR